MTTWADLVPAGFTLVGVAVASTTSLVSQSLANRGTANREATARYDDLRFKRFDVERETLLKLQDTLLEHLDLVAKALDVAEADSGEALKTQVDAVLRSELKLSMLMSRCLARDAVEAVEACMAECREIVKTLDYTRNPAQSFRRAQEQLGHALRRDPFNSPPSRGTRSARRASSRRSPPFLR